MYNFKMINKQSLILSFIGIVMCFISVYLFTTESLWDRFDFSNTGQIGDTIGGLTSPIIGLLGSILV